MWERGWDEEATQDRILLQTLTGALSCPLTAWASLSLFAQQIQERTRADERLEVHIIGAADKNEGSLLQSGWAWDELGEVSLPQTVHLHALRSWHSGACCDPFFHLDTCAVAPVIAFRPSFIGRA